MQTCNDLLDKQQDDADLPVDPTNSINDIHACYIRKQQVSQKVNVARSIHELSPLRKRLLNLFILYFEYL